MALKLPVGSFLQLWEKTGILGGKVKFEDYRLITYLTLDRAAAEISIHYGQELAVVRKMGGRIPHILVSVRSGTDLKTKINRNKSQRSIRPNLHSAVYDNHHPAGDTMSWSLESGTSGSASTRRVDLIFHGGFRPLLRMRRCL